MTVQQKIFALTIGAGLFLVIIELVRRRKLAEEYSFIWLLTGFGIIVLILWYDLLEWLTYLIGAKTPTTTLFIFGFVFLILLNLYLSIKITKLASQVKDLAQKLAISEKADRR
ncbi:MAG: DUF2304 domain-containing protein [Nitrospirae bacterium]|nr:DUF2304 domain-containing protein [Nitrospirota bacterium]MBI3378792.1 DUF2304 domain-containing protein [Nitrospirota bacterium]